MTVQAYDMEFRLSGGDINLVPGDSLGGIMSDQEIASGYLANLFDNVSPAEGSSGDTEYRCFYVINTNDTDSITGLRIWIQVETSSPDSEIDLGLDPAGVGNGKTTGVATTIANESTAPSGVSFSHPVDFLSGLVIGTLDAGEAQSVWIKRTIGSGASSYVKDRVWLRIEGTVS